MTVKEREQKQLLRRYKKRYGTKDVIDVINVVEQSLSEKRDELEDLESDIWRLEEDLDWLKTVQKATCKTEKPMAKHATRPKTERRLSAFFGGN